MTVLSHEDDVNVGVIADPAAVGDLEMLVHLLKQAFAEVIGLAEEISSDDAEGQAS